MKLAVIARRFQMDPNEVLDNIICARAHNSEQQMELLADAAALMCETRFGLMVVDSATALYRTDYNGRGELSER
jgi:DNA repair protein RAD51